MTKNAVIMAGGTGERFWPMSRRNRPKQLLELTSSGKLMIQEAIDRIKPIFDEENIYIITGKALKKPIENALPNIPAENIIAEPAKRNTAPCLALAAGCLLSKESSDEQVIAVLTADHIMEPEEKFRQTVNTALDFVESNKVISTIGIKPTRPETGYGYIETGDNLKDNSENPVYKVLNFTEKPDLETAKEYYNSDKFYWNSGMFFYSLDTFISEMKQHLPEVGENIEKLNLQNSNLGEVFTSFPNISIDYGLMEKTENAVVVVSNFNWDDLGAFDSLDRVNKKDENGNIIKGNVIAINCKNSIIINTGDKLSTAYGLEDMVLVQTEDASLSCIKKDAQHVKQIVEEIKKNKLEQYL